MKKQIELLAKKVAAQDERIAKLEAENQAQKQQSPGKKRNFPPNRSKHYESEFSDENIAFNAKSPQKVMHHE